jgi:hypothetical protein
MSEHCIAIIAVRDARTAPSYLIQRTNQPQTEDALISMKCCTDMSITQQMLLFHNYCAWELTAVVLNQLCWPWKPTYLCAASTGIDLPFQPTAMFARTPQTKSIVRCCQIHVHVLAAVVCQLT